MWRTPSFCLIYGGKPWDFILQNYDLSAVWLDLWLGWVLKFNSREVLWRWNRKQDKHLLCIHKVSHNHGYPKTDTLTFRRVVSSQCICSNCPGIVWGIHWRSACLPGLNLVWQVSNATKSGCEVWQAHGTYTWKWEKDRSEISYTLQESRIIFILSWIRLVIKLLYSRKSIVCRLGN